jgi:hypothetical protein
VSDEPLRPSDAFGSIHDTLGLGEPCEDSLLDVVDHLLDKGCVITGSAVFALAEVDLVYLELRVLACAAERMLGSERLR